MKKILKALEFTGVILFLTVFFIACDKDFSSVESDVLGSGNSNILDNKFTGKITAYNKKLDSLQINNLTSALLGFYNDPAYGSTSASIITQVDPAIDNPSFGTNPKIDSVVLTIPYFSKIIGQDSLGNAIYSIKDSLYGNAPIDLKIYQNNYFLRDFDPSSPTDAQQNYFSKADGAIVGTDNHAITGSSTINFDNFKGDLIYRDSLFVPSNETIVLKTLVSDGNDEITRSSPRLRVKLDTTFWHNTIFEKEGQIELSNDNNFKNYFRGLYIKATPVNDQGNMILLNFGQEASTITIYYTSGETDLRTKDSYTLNLTGNRLNTFINNYSKVDLSNTNDDKLYLKGIEGSMAVVDLFGGLVDCDGDGNVDDDALECFRKNYLKLDDGGNYLDPVNGRRPLKRLINEAQLVIYEDETLNDEAHKYDRIYVYDVRNNLTTTDYDFDPTLNSSDPLSSKVISLGQRSTNNGGPKYKIRLTEYLNNILTRDSTNTKIGLVLSPNVNNTSSSRILNSNDTVTRVPSASMLIPRGTILYGATDNVPENKRMKLEIYYSEPKETN
ncbi:DUF4270 domain-containing protein [Flavobacteriaceae bacterium XHP0103]|uniref:DUF4270 domain-containing protein n=1 Tax=Marixanthotalea marina TaxID=2844359 RepID=UPI002989F15A|nr:DUF4270 domain-containing protein [Marixanthotalea marina]MBU3820812.1 DUF4270 domain-containing protein [Marixanthotalea marina]